MPDVHPAKEVPEADVLRDEVDKWMREVEHERRRPLVKRLLQAIHHLIGLAKTGIDNKLPGPDALTFPLLRFQFGETLTDVRIPACDCVTESKPRNVVNAPAVEGNAALDAGDCLGRSPAGREIAIFWPVTDVTSLQPPNF